MDALVSFGAAGPACVRLPTPAQRSRSAVATRRPNSIAGLAGPGAGGIAHAVMQAVLALHDDQVLDAGRLSPPPSPPSPSHVWIELRPDLLELAAVVASRCDDHQRALLLLAAGARARVDTGVRFRFRDQQAWIDAALAAARTELGDDQVDSCRAQAASMTTDDAFASPAVAAASVGAQPLAGTPSHPPSAALSISSPKASPTRRSPNGC